MAVDKQMIDTADQLAVLDAAVNDLIALTIGCDHGVTPRDAPVIENDVILLGAANSERAAGRQCELPAASGRFSYF